MCTKPHELLSFFNSPRCYLAVFAMKVFENFLARAVERLKAPVLAMFREVDKSSGGQRYHHRFNTELPTVAQLNEFANIMVEVRYLAKLSNCLPG